MPTPHTFHWEIEGTLQGLWVKKAGGFDRTVVVVRTDADDDTYMEIARHDDPECHGKKIYELLTGGEGKKVTITFSKEVLD